MDHLPECPLVEACNDEIPEHGYCSMQHGMFCIHCHQWCICDALRACEQRVKRFGRPLWHLKGATWGHEQGWNEALDAAREAVAGLRTYGDHGEVIPPDEEAAVIYVTDALAAIDALKEKP